MAAPLKRILFLWHRYLGVVLGVLFVLWFISGVVMMYARFPILTPDGRFSQLPTFDPHRFRLGPEAARERTGLAGPPQRVRLGVLLDRPIYYFLFPERPWIGVYGDVGDVLAPVGPDLAADVARRATPTGAAPRFLATVDGVDQWTLTNSLNRHRPLHRFALGDARGTEVYVAARTGEVVMRTTRRERTLSWLGPIVHWGAIEILRTRVGPWRQTILWLSVVGVVVTMTGLVAGLLRFRRRGYVLKGVTPDRRQRSPYLGVKRLHHWVGLVFGGVTLAWVLSGLLFLNPGGRRQGDLSTTTQMTPYSVGGVRASTGARPGQADAMRGGPLAPALWTESPGAAWARVLRNGTVGPGIRPKEIELHRFAGRPYYVFWTDAFDSVTVAADGADAPPRRRHPTAALVARARHAVEGELRAVHLLTEYDAYYYSVGDVAPKRLPVLRLAFDDPATNLMYIDPHTGRIVRAYDTHAKVMRWLVMGLHNWDIPWLILRRPAWDLTLLVLSAGGLFLSVSGLLTNWQRLRPRGRNRRS